MNKTLIDLAAVQSKSVLPPNEANDASAIVKGVNNLIGDVISSHLLALHAVKTFSLEESNDNKLLEVDQVLEILGVLVAFNTAVWPNFSAVLPMLSSLSVRTSRC